MTEHTPGPWAVINTISGALSINAAPRVPIGTIGGMGWHLGEETARANARLIAASPDMLHALLDFIHYHDEPNMSMGELLRRACDAVEKALGYIPVSPVSEDEQGEEPVSNAR